MSAPPRATGASMVEERRAERPGDPDRVLAVTHRGEPLGFVVVDAPIGGRAGGGVRMLPDVTEEEIRSLARAMTLKAGWLGRAYGGAKAGVRGDPEAPLAERRARLAAFGRAIVPWLRSGAFAAHTDMGTTPSDVDHLYRAAGVRRRRRDRRLVDSGRWTAATAFEGARAALARHGLALRGIDAAIEGFGAVGRPLARQLHEAGARVVAVSTSRGLVHDPAGLDVPALAAATVAEGSRVVETFPAASRDADPAVLLTLDVDLLCPCARGASLHAGNVEGVRARAVAAGANDPITRPAEARLLARGVALLPDFVTNAGGVLGGTMAFASIAPARIAAFVRERIGPRMDRLFVEAERRGVAPRVVAEEEARARFDAMRETAERRPARERLLALGGELYAQGLVPGLLFAPLAERYFTRMAAPSRPSDR